MQKRLRASDRTAKRPIVLIVEDDFLIRMNAAEMIADAGFEQSSKRRPSNPSSRRSLRYHGRVYRYSNARLYGPPKIGGGNRVGGFPRRWQMYSILVLRAWRESGVRLLRVATLEPFLILVVIHLIP
jgi:hypothetical protein